MDQADPFPSSTTDAWRRRVQAELGDTAFDTLSTTLPGGIVVQPLYTAAEAIAREAIGAPGEAPFTRGRAPQSSQRWINCPRYDLAGPGAVNDAILDDLTGGAGGVWIEFDRAGRLGHDATDEDAVGIGVGGVDIGSLADLARVFDGVYLDMIRVVVDPGGNALPAAALVDGLISEHDIDPERVSVWLAIDPLGAWARDGAMPGTLDRLEAELAALTRRSIDRADGWRTIGVSSLVYHDAGAHAVDELGFALATAAHYLRTLERAGVDLDAAADRIAFRVAVGRDVFLAIAKLRALRRAWSEMLDAIGVRARAAAIHACVSDRMMTRWDAETNTLRATSAVFAALCGDADVISGAPYDRPAGGRSARGRRIARNVGTILAEESHLADVVDPAGGSHYVESLTDAVARAAWDTLQLIERAGGMADALRGGIVQARVHAAYAARRSAIDRREIPITGVTEFPDGSEAVPVDHDATRRDAIAAATRRADEARRTRGPLEIASLAAGDFAAAAREVARGVTIGELSVACARGAGEAIEPLLARRDAALFEALREAGRAGGAHAFIAAVGPLAEHQPFSRFAQNALLVGGFDVTAHAGAAADDPRACADELAAAYRASGAPVVCVCGVRAALDRTLGPIVAALRDAGASTVIATASPGSVAGLDAVVRHGVDLRALLVRLLHAAGIDVEAHR